MNAFVNSPTVGIPGLSHRCAAKLVTHGIRTRLDLAGLCRDRRLCIDIAERMGLSPSELERFANRAHLLSLNEMNERHLNLLIEAGITSVDDLAATSCQVLRKHLEDIAAYRPNVAAPSPMTLLGWIAEARLQANAFAA